MTSSISPDEFEQFARACQAAHAAGALSPDQLKALHAKFIARGADGSIWTVGLATLAWHVARNGQWQPGTPPPQLQVEDALLGELRGIEASTLSTAPAIDGAALKRMLERTLHAIGGADRGPLGGLLMALEAGVLSCVASDGHRLVLATGAVVKAPAARAESIIPRDLVLQLMERLGRAVGPVAIEIGGTRVRFGLAEQSLTAAALSGTFPNYRLVMPRAPGGAVGLDRDALAAAVRRIAPPDGDMPRPVGLATRAKALGVADPATNRSEALPATVHGTGFEATFESRYLLDALGALDGGTIELASDGPSAPALLAHPGRDDVRIIVMPRRG